MLDKGSRDTGWLDREGLDAARQNTVGLDTAGRIQQGWTQAGMSEQGRTQRGRIKQNRTKGGKGTYAAAQEGWTQNKAEQRRTVLSPVYRRAKDTGGQDSGGQVREFININVEG